MFSYLGATFIHPGAFDGFRIEHRCGFDRGVEGYRGLTDRWFNDSKQRVHLHGEALTESVTTLFQPLYALHVPVRVMLYGQGKSQCNVTEDACAM